MTKSEALKTLEKAGTAQNRKIYGRHGVTSPMFGVSYANMGKIKKSIGTDQALAESLWATGNHDARVLATMIADPSAISAKTIDAWSKDLDNYVITGALSSLVARSRHARSRMERWTGARDEWRGSAGWSILGSLIVGDEGLPKEALEQCLKTIETDIHGAKNRVRYAMNNALIAIGMVSSGLEKKAIAAAKRIGKVEVDHGETGCKTPDAVTYIPKAAAHHRAKLAKQSSKAGGKRSTAKTARR